MLMPAAPFTNHKSSLTFVNFSALLIVVDHLFPTIDSTLNRPLRIRIEFNFLNLRSCFLAIDQFPIVCNKQENSEESQDCELKNIQFHLEKLKVTLKSRKPDHLDKMLVRCPLRNNVSSV
mgnify:CR=1 FL=1